MAWGDLASNQMVSYTDAQGGGFTLQPGQSSVTSNQCMTKDNALAKYILDSSYMSSYAGNQLVPKSAWVGGVVNSVVFSSLYSYTGSSSANYSGTVTITGASATFNARSTSTGNFSTDTNINIGGNARRARQTTTGTLDSTTFTLTPGTYSYTFSCQVTGGGTGIGQIIFTQ